MKIALFFGAGMSVVFDKPTTRKFKELLSDVSGDTLFHDALMHSFLEVNEFPDVEYILKSLEDIVNFSQSNGGLFFSHIAETIPQHIMTFYHGTKFKYTQLVNEITNLKKTIEDQVFEQYSWNHEKDDLLNKIFDPIIGRLDAMNNEIKIITTNYDQAIETFCSQKDNFHCNDGFKLDSNSSRFLWNDGNYDELNFDGKINFHLYKLHGSLNWKNHKKYGIERTTFERKPNDSNYDKDFLIYPSLSPKDGMIHEPYATIRSKFNDFLKNVDVCIVIGFSFRDEHLNKIFTNFVSSNKKLIVISPSSLKDVGNVIDASLYEQSEQIFRLKKYNIVGFTEEVSEKTIQQVADFIEAQLKI